MDDDSSWSDDEIRTLAFKVGREHGLRELARRRFIPRLMDLGRAHGKTVRAGCTTRIQRILTEVRTALKSGQRAADVEGSTGEAAARQAPEWLSRIVRDLEDGVSRDADSVRAAAEERIAATRREADEMMVRRRHETEAEIEEIRNELDEATEDLQTAAVALESERHRAAASEAMLGNLQRQHADVVGTLTAERDAAQRLADRLEVELSSVRREVESHVESRRLAEHLGREHATGLEAARATTGRLRAELDEMRSALRVAEAELRLLRERASSEHGLAALAAALAGEDRTAVARRSGSGGVNARVRRSAGGSASGAPAAAPVARAGSTRGPDGSSSHRDVSHVAAPAPDVSPTAAPSPRAAA
jgi:hypothetical protein